MPKPYPKLNKKIRIQRQNLLSSVGLSNNIILLTKKPNTVFENMD